ncbi:hypothetical protein BDN67DRAFT_562911 [Paxillus ammoniavirescens]|nr:hypothetical protein BDN67DRAFT_562911 [Paxillus ammoniavirescens]
MVSPIRVLIARRILVCCVCGRSVGIGMPGALHPIAIFQLSSMEPEGILNGWAQIRTCHPIERIALVASCTCGMVLSLDCQLIGTPPFHGCMESVLVCCVGSSPTKTRARPTRHSIWI